MLKPLFGVLMLIANLMFLTSGVVHAEKFYIYHEFEPADRYVGNGDWAHKNVSHGFWTNIMPGECGANNAAAIDLNDRTQPAAVKGGQSAVKLTFKIPTPPGWCGLAVTSNENFWGKTPANATPDLNKYYPYFNLQPYQKLVFSAKGAGGNEVIQVKFAITGDSGDQGWADSAPLPIDCGSFTLTSGWREYVCPIKIDDPDRPLFLGRVITPFVVTVSKIANNSADSVGFYLDEIYFDTDK
ncbi:MAG: hypothetical protein ABSB19_11680 [Methylomonas sp.]|jgi:hypothetical protein